MIRLYRISRTELLDTQLALTMRIHTCLEDARSEPLPWVTAGYCQEAARYVRAYRAISSGGPWRRKYHKRADLWAKEITMLLMCAEGKRQWSKATPDSTP